MSSSPHDHPDLAPPYLVEVAPGVFGYIQPDGSWFINNTGFVAGRSGTLSIDTCATERRTRDYLRALRQTSGSEPLTLANTHHHGDHTNGNCLLPFAAIIGHEQCRQEILRTGILRPDGFFEPVEWGELIPAPPFVTFEQRLNVYVDDLRVELLHLSTAAHTTNDVVAWIPEHRVLLSGDVVVNGSTPFALMGSVAGWLEALDAIIELDPAVIVPGHGEVCGMEAVDTCGRYLRWLQMTAPELWADGLSPMAAARTVDLGDFALLADPERLVGNLHRAYAECEGRRPGDPIDVGAALADMVTFNGGRPLRCRA